MPFFAKLFSFGTTTLQVPMHLADPLDEWAPLFPFFIHGSRIERAYDMVQRAHYPGKQ